MSDSHISLSGRIIDHAHDVFRVLVDNTEDHIVKAKLSGKMRLNKINLQLNDKVVVEVSIYDTSMGRIVSRVSDRRRGNVEQNGGT